MVVAANIMSPLPKSNSGFTYILVIQDLFTKQVECRALRVANRKKIRETLEDLILSRWVTPKFLITNNGTEFVNQTLQVFAQEYGITHTIVPPYYPQVNPMERLSRVLKSGSKLQQFYLRSCTNSQIQMVRQRGRCTSRILNHIGPKILNNRFTLLTHHIPYYPDVC